MDPNEIDAFPRETGQHPLSELGDSEEWAAIDAYRGRTPPDHDEEWTISSISRRFAHGEGTAEVVESPTGEPVTRGEPHWYVTIRRDQFPQTNTTTAEDVHYVVPTGSALAAWFEEDEECSQ